MKNPLHIEQFNSFEEKLSKFKQNPESYRFKIKNRFFRQMYNALIPFFVWLFISVGINFFMYTYFQKADNRFEATALISIIALFLTIASRNYTVNYFLFETIGGLGKYYTLHQVANRIGFFHRFMAFSTLAWFLIHFQYSKNSIALILIVLITTIIISAFAIFRRRFHNTFEDTHRYLGYIAIFLLLVYYVQSNLANEYTLFQMLVKPHSIFLIFIIAMLISPWLGLKKVSPKLVHVGEHVIGIEVEGEPSFGTYSKITLANGHYHPFGDSMINFDDLKNRTLYMTPAGDRTSKIVYGANRGEFLLDKCHIKKDRNRGFMYFHSNYDHILIVVTGGGIAPIIPCLVLNDHTKIDVLWIGRKQPEEFTPELLTKLITKLENKEIGIHIIDTTKDEYKNFNNENYAALALEAFNHYQPEVAFVMSNQNFTIDVMCAFNENGINSYGATFDS